MSNALSSTTVPIALRLPVDTYSKIVKRAGRKGQKVSEYLRHKIIYDVNRQHGS